MRTVKQVSEITGVSVRTLHHYDAIGLLHPTEVTEAGYRLYDDEAIERLQSILLFRELQFPLKEIGEILDSPQFDRTEALAQQIKLLELQRSHIDRLIAFAREIQEKGAYKMNFDVFDCSELEQYKAEVRERWGETDAYREYAQKDKGNFEAAARRMMELFAELGALSDHSPADEAVQEKVHALRTLITENYYTCTPEILRGLGQMYTGDARFKKNIDRAGGEGTADFAARAIEIYCAAQKE